MSEINFCPKCGKQQISKREELALPDGDGITYKCGFCGFLFAILAIE